MLVAPCDIMTIKKEKGGGGETCGKIPTLFQVSLGASKESLVKKKKKTKRVTVCINDLSDTLDSEFLDLPCFFNRHVVSCAPVSNPNPIIAQNLSLKCTFGKPTPGLEPPVCPGVIPADPVLWLHPDTQAVVSVPFPA